MSAGKNSPEYETLRKANAVLSIAIVSCIDTTNLCDKLVSAGLINDDQKRSVTNTQVTANTRTSNLLSMILTKVELDSKHFGEFVEVLQTDLSSFGDVLQVLDINGQ